MQALKDTFYLMLRDRVAAGNSARVVVVRGVSRPAVVVTENELPNASAAGSTLLETFCLQWVGANASGAQAIPLSGVTCEIHYASDGTSGNAGMDRGRALAAMDTELFAALNAEPQSVPKVIAVAGQSTVSTGDGTNVFWGDVVYGPAVMRNERMERTATVWVYGYGEYGYGE